MTSCPYHNLLRILGTLHTSVGVDSGEAPPQLFFGGADVPVSSFLSSILYPTTRESTGQAVKKFMKMADSDFDYDVILEDEFDAMYVSPCTRRGQMTTSRRCS